MCWHKTVRAGISVRTKPRQRTDNERFDPGFQRRMQHGRELQAVIDRKFIQLARSLGLLINRGIVAAHEPEHRWHLPRCAETAEILTRRCGAGMFHPLGRKVATEGLGDAIAGSLVIDVERVAVERRYLRFAWRAGGVGLGVDD